jgi:DUF2075 family protein
MKRSCTPRGSIGEARVIIYNETRTQFLDDVFQNCLKQRLMSSFRTMTNSIPADQSVWDYEYGRLASVLQNAQLEPEVQVAIEYHLCAAGRWRIDALLLGNDGQRDNGLIIELKAWDRAGFAEGEGLVFSPLQGGKICEHPALQAKKYKDMILRFNEDVHKEDIGLHSAAYLFNLHRRAPEPLEAERYQNILAEAKLFLANDAERFRDHIESVVSKRPKKNIVQILENGKLRPTDELIYRVSSMLEGNEEFLLIDEQSVAFEQIRYFLLPTKAKKNRQVFIVEGGPGTGKSVIAVRLLAEILKQKRMGFFVAPNRAFRATLVEHLARRNEAYRDDGQALFQSSWSFHDADYDKANRYEVLLIDEAHRLKSKAHMYQGENMVEDMVRASNISVFFIDETQRVQWNDIGSIGEIRKAAEKFGAICHKPFKLTAQFRCNGSDAYLNWLDDVLQIRPTANFESWGDLLYDFKVFDDASLLYESLKVRNTENKARLVAGYAWEWPTKGAGRKRGTTATHVEADGLALPWNFDGENWATAADGINQVGCVHTIQGLEFDWLGILIGNDLLFKEGLVIGDRRRRAKTDASLNGSKKALEEAAGNPQLQQELMDRVDLIIKSTYKVLLSRGRKGCFVWCADPGLRHHFKTRLAMMKRKSE